MNARTIPAKDALAKWRKDSAFRVAYDALEEEFALAAQLIEARARAGLTQAELAERMGTSQSAVARLESGKAKPSVATLEKLAAATGSKLRIALEAA
jgi:ribosome-binding protein aMBF1 (putative translation factor)